MKIQIVETLSSKLIGLDSSELDVDKFYGVSFESTLGKRRAFVTATYYNGIFVMRAAEDFTLGNGWDNFEGGTLKELFKQLFEGLDKCEIYQFDSFKELMDWVSSE